MLVTLIGKNTLYKLKLPNEHDGNYWIKNDNETKLVNIFGRKDEWQICSNEQVKILAPKSITSFNISKIKDDPKNIINKVVLREGCIYYLA